MVGAVRFGGIGLNQSGPTYYGGGQMPTRATGAPVATPMATPVAAPVAGPAPIGPAANPLTQNFAGGPSTTGDPVSQLQGQYAGPGNGVTPQNSWATNSYGTGLGSVAAGVAPNGGTWGASSSPGGWLPPGRVDTGGTSWQNPTAYTPSSGTTPGAPTTPAPLQTMPGFTAPSTGGPPVNGTSIGMQPMGPGYIPQQSNPTSNPMLQPMNSISSPQMSVDSPGAFGGNSLLQMGGNAYSPLASAGYGYDPVDHDPFSPPGA